MFFRWKKKITRKRCKRITRSTKNIEEEIRKKYNPDDIFKDKRQNIIEEIQPNEENTSIIVVKEEKWYKKIFNLVKGLFKRK